MKTEFFIAKRLSKEKKVSRNVSKPIVKISILSIIISVAVMIISLSIVIGFQKEIRSKVIGFGSHIQVMNAGEYSPYESTPMLKKQDFYPNISKSPEVSHIQCFAYKPAILKSSIDSVKVSLNEKDTFEIKQEIGGIIVKGVDEKYDWSFFYKNLKKGRLPKYNDSIKSKEILISQFIANQMKYKLGDEIDAFFIQDKPKKRKFKIVGIYNTGFEEFDKELILSDIKQIQKMNHWGINATFKIDDTLENYFLKFYIDAIGGTGHYKYNYGYGYEYSNFGYICPNKDTSIIILVSDYSRIKGIDSILSIPDTIWVDIKVEGNKFASCIPNKLDKNILKKEFLNEEGTSFKINLKEKSIVFNVRNSGKSPYQYVGGFEILLNSWKDLDNVDEIAKNNIVLPSLIKGKPLRVETIKKLHADIFEWLDFLDLLTLIIVVLMILVAIINMGSTILVIILEKTNMIGILKSFGTPNKFVRKIFLFQSLFLILKGIFWGNLLGIGLVMIQKYFKIIPLDPKIYFMNYVAVDINLLYILLLNLMTLIICIIAMLIPVLLVSNIKPVKAIKFN